MRKEIFFIPIVLILVIVLLAQLSAVFDKNVSKTAFLCGKTLVNQHSVIENANVVT